MIHLSAQTGFKPNGRKPKIPKTGFIPTGPKSCRIHFHLSQADREKLRKIWKQRSYPDPYKPERDIRFVSEQEYLEFIIRALNEAGPSAWYFLKHALNPDFPQD